MQLLPYDRHIREISIAMFRFPAHLLLLIQRLLLQDFRVKCASLRVPGIGTILLLFASNHANAICDGVAPFLAAYVLSHSMMGIFKGRNSFEKRGNPERKSVFSSNFVFVSIVPVKKPAPTGDHGTKPMPNSSHV